LPSTPALRSRRCQANAPRRRHDTHDSCPVYERCAPTNADEMSTVSAPSLLDRVDLLLLRIAKRGRPRYAHDAAFYEAFFAEHDLTKYVLDVRNAWRFGLISRIVDGAFPDGAAVVDVGCGLGSARRFLNPKHAYIGVDVSSESLEAARRIHDDTDTRFERGSLPSLPLASEAADVALCLEVLEHLPEDKSAFAELNRIVRPGGLLVISVPNSYFWPEYESLIGHYRHYESAELAELVERNGFRVIRHLPQHRDFWRLYHYFYLGLRVIDAIGRRVRSDFTVYTTTPYRALSKGVLAVLRRREWQDDGSSTFVLCTRRPLDAS
jgi:SAM-dependent methyltransferase